MTNPEQLRRFHGVAMLAANEYLSEGVAIAKQAFVDMLNSGSQKAVAWDRDVTDLPVTDEIPRYYPGSTSLNGIKTIDAVYCGIYNESSQPVYSWVEDPIDSLGGKWNLHRLL